MGDGQCWFGTLAFKCDFLCEVVKIVTVYYACLLSIYGLLCLRRFSEFVLSFVLRSPYAY